jgi:hypothetical protein
VQETSERSIIPTLATGIYLSWDLAIIDVRLLRMRKRSSSQTGAHVLPNVGWLASETLEDSLLYPFND